MNLSVCTRVMMGLLVAFLFQTTIASTYAQDQPNILWLTSEDNNVNWVGCYGNPHALTPHIDRLASEGFLYTHCYSNAPVCAPMRSAWITGVHSVSMGTHPMRSRYPIPHDRIRYYPDLLKDAGYFVGNAKKTDYNIGGREDREAWDIDRADWNQLKQHQPFFMVINSTKSHESKAFGDVTNTTHDPDNIRLARYHPDIPVIRQNYAHYHDQVSKMDQDIGDALAALEKSGMAENTIVVHCSDHGGVLARSKRFLYDSGTHCPLIVRIPEKYKHLRPGQPGSKVDALVSFIDMPKTWLQICGAQTPEYLQGKTFLGPEAESRDYHISYRGRMDERCDNVRAIRDNRFLYIRNYMPYAPWGQRLEYLWRMKATQAWEQHHLAGKTDAITGRFFGTKPAVELYDSAGDPDNVVNLADDPAYADDLQRLGLALDKWQRDNYDAGLIPETEIVHQSEIAGKTIYDLVRDPELYDVKKLQEVSAMALQPTASDLEALQNLLASEDVGVRYWATVGCFHLSATVDAGRIDLDAIRNLLADDSHHVRAMAAWAMYRCGEQVVARECWNQLLRESSYASLKVLNIIDWIGEGPESYADSIKACKFEHGNYITQMKEYYGME